MSALCQKRTLRGLVPMSAFGGKGDISSTYLDVRYWNCLAATRNVDFLGEGLPAPSLQLLRPFV